MHGGEVTDKASGTSWLSGKAGWGGWRRRGRHISTRQSIRSPAGKCNPSPKCHYSINIHYKNEMIADPGRKKVTHTLPWEPP